MGYTAPRNGALRAAICDLHKERFNCHPSRSMYSTSYVEALRLLLLASGDCASIIDIIDTNDAAYEFMERISSQGYIIGRQEKLQLRKRRRVSRQSRGRTSNANETSSGVVEVVDIN